MGYQGQTVTIPLGNQGLLTDINPSDIPITALIRANNVNLGNGNIEKANGSHKYNSSALSSGIVALFDWHPSSITQRLIALTSDGSIYKDSGDRLFNGGTAINTGLGSPSVRSQFVEGGNETAGRNKKLFLFTENNQVQVLSGDGTTFADIATPAADWSTPNFPTGGIIHRNRLWAFGNDNAKSRIYASNTGDHEDFTASFLTFNIFPGEGGRLIGAYVFKGRLFVFKEGDFVYYLNDGDSNSSNWYFSKLSSSFGLASPHGLLQAMDDVLVANTVGSITSMRAADTFGDIESADLLAVSQIENYVRETTSISGAQFSHTLYYGAKKLAYFTFRSKYGGTNDRVLVMDLNRKQPRFSFLTKDSPDVLALRKDINGVGRPIYGDASGYVYTMDEEDRDVGGNAYTGEFKTPHTDFRSVDPSIVHKEKHFDWIAVEFIPQGNWNLSADVFIDGKFSETLTFSMKTRSDGMDTFTLDEDDLGREESQLSPMKPLHGTGRRISLRFYNSGLLENFKLSSYTIGFRPAGEGPTRL